MSNSDSKNKSSGFLSRIFGRSAGAPGAASGESSETINGTAIEQAGGKRLTKSKSILIIAEEDSAMRRWQREIEQWGYGIESIPNGEKGLDLLYEVAFDAVLLDYEATGIDGARLLQEIRSHEELKSLFIGVFVRDAAGESEKELAALSVGASRVFQRSSVKIDGILTALKTALFPRVLQAQPRTRQASPLAVPSVPSVPSSRSTEPVPARIAPAPLPTPPSVRGETFPQPEPAIRRVVKLEMALEPSAVAPLNKKVLIIDADEAVAGIYRAQIEAAGYEVEVALDGETGFHDLYNVSPDALLLDLLLPGGLSGSEILKKTRAQKKFEKIPVLVFTNIYTRDVEDEAKAAGALRLFNKAAATPRDVIDALNEIFLPTASVFGGQAGRPTIKFDAAGSNAPAPAAPSPASPGSVTLPPLPVQAVASHDADFQEEIRESLLQGAPEFVKDLRGMLQVLLRSQGDLKAQSAQLLELYTRVHSLTANAAIAGFVKVARLSGALEAMLREFEARPEGLNASTKRTLTQAMDFLAMLFTGAATHESGQPINEQILIVDDEIISRRVIGHSLEKAGLKSTAVSHPDEALKLLEANRFDLIFLDVEMPGMNGFELCKKLRAMPLHTKTPVIFVTALGGFESRAKSSLSGGDDFIGKPFSYIELAVKGLMNVLKGSLAQEADAAKTPPPAPPAPAIAPRRTQMISMPRS